MKCRRLDRKNGKGLAKDQSGPIKTQTFEKLPLSQPGFTKDTVRGKGTWTPDNVVMPYPKIPDVAHEFTARLQFGSSFEVMDFLEGQQIKLSQRMAEEHAETQMIQHALARTAE